MRVYLPLATIVTALAALLCVGVASADPNPPPEPIPPSETIYPDCSTALGARPPEAPGSELSERGRNLRGLYVPYGRVRAWTPRQLVRWVQKIGVNAAVIDVKDDRGRVTFARDLPLADGRPHGQVGGMERIVSALKEAGIYTIGRLVCFKDDQLYRLRPETAVRDLRSGKPWTDIVDMHWVDPHSELVREHIESVARAAQEVGFDEIQLDYVRFPVDSRARWARYPNREGEPKRYEVIAALLERVDRALDIPLSIDVFGLTAYKPGDPDGLGQSLEHLAPYIDAVTPMVYLANWPRNYWDNPRPSKTYDVINGAIERIRERLDDRIAVRPLLQAFRWRAKNFSTSFIHNQIDAAVSGGSSGYLFWNHSSNYYRVKLALEQLDEAGRRSLPVVSSR
jgi:hypothetical protein